VSLLVVASLTIVSCGGGSGKASNTTNSTATSTTAAATTTTAASTTTTTTVPQSPLLAGNARPQYPQGAPHELSVVYQAPISESQGGDVIVPIVFRNNTSKAVAHVDITAAARDASGKIVGSGDGRGVVPSNVLPGQWAYAYIYYGHGTAVKPGDTLSFSFDTSPVGATPGNTADVHVTEANKAEDYIAGSVQNKTGHKIGALVNVVAYCLNGSGKPTDALSGFAADNGLNPDATATFQIDLYGHACTSFLVGAYGYYD
jgi:hypothetical protein